MFILYQTLHIRKGVEVNLQEQRVLSWMCVLLPAVLPAETCTERKGEAMAVWLTLRSLLLLTINECYKGMSRSGLSASPGQ